MKKQGLLIPNIGLLILISAIAWACGGTSTEEAVSEAETTDTTQAKITVAKSH